MRACDNHVPCVLVTCWETLAAMVACVEEVCKIWIGCSEISGAKDSKAVLSCDGPRKDLLSLAFLPPGSGKGMPESGDGQPE